MGTPVKIKDGTLDGPTSLYEMGLTLMHPFFGEEERFKKQFENWRNFPKEIKDNVKIILVDDCGTPPIHELVTPSYKKRIDFDLSIYRITDDLRFNTAGALNLGILSAPSEWILIMDSDCLFEPEEFDKLMQVKPQKGWYYKFPRNRITEDAHWATNIRYLPCTMLMHKDMFLDLNGFDEDFTGTYSGGYAFFDNHFDFKAKKYGYDCGEIPWITATEYMDDFVGERVSRTKVEEGVNRKIMYSKMEGKTPESKHMLRFSWEKVL